MIVWNDSYLMGIESFDHDHRQMFKIAGQIMRMVENRGDNPWVRMFAIREGVTYIASYFQQHVEREEAYMRQIGYPGYEMHKQLHDDFYKRQVERFRGVVESGQCSKEDLDEFIGSCVGWLLEHIVTADMAIVGKGVHSAPKLQVIDRQSIEREINTQLTAILNIEVNAKIVDAAYAGDYFGKSVCQKFVYGREGGAPTTTVISGVENAFLLDVAKMIYGPGVEDEIGLVMSTLEAFGENFWRSLSARLVGQSTDAKVNVLENEFLLSRRLPEEIEKLKPTLSLLFHSDKGKFFVSTNFPLAEYQEEPQTPPASNGTDGTAVP